MNVALINPSERKFLDSAGDRPPLGLMYLSGALKQNNIDCNIYDLNHIDIEGLLHGLENNNPDIIGITGMSPTFNQMSFLSRLVRNRSNKTKIIAGGFHATHVPESLETLVDVIVRGYGEEAILSISTGKNIRNFDINRYPIPDRSIANSTKYNMKLDGLQCTIMNTGRGCPYNCAFCGNFDRKQKVRCLDSIEEELKIIKNQGYKAVYLVDDSFTMNKEHAFGVMNLMYEAGLKYRIETRANLIDRNTARKLKSTGCLLVGIGVESGSDDVLRIINKGETIHDMTEGFRNLELYDVKSKGFFIFGLPGESHDDAKLTIEYAQRLKGYGMVSADFYTLAPFPGSPIWNNPEKFGMKILSRDFTKYLVAGKDVPECYVHNGFYGGSQVRTMVKLAKREFENA